MFTTRSSASAVRRLKSEVNFCEVNLKLPDVESRPVCTLQPVVQRAMFIQPVVQRAMFIQPVVQRAMFIQPVVQRRLYKRLQSVNTVLHWQRGVVVSGVRRMNEVNAHRARLVLGWVTVFGWVYYFDL